MASENLKNLSSFGQAAVALDTDFLELERLSGQISRLDLESESGLDRAVEGLNKFKECGERIGQGIQSLATTLNDMRGRAESSAQLVAERAIQIQERCEERDRMVQRYRSLVELVQKASEFMSQFKKLEGNALTEEEKAFLPTQVSELDAALMPLIEELRKLKEDARKSKMKMVERNSESLSQSLEAARRKLASAFGESQSQSQDQSQSP